jgi:sec-independent protein translocase protein TatC
LVQEVSEQKLTIIEHLDELRSRLVICVIAVAVTTIVSLFFVQHIFDILKGPAPEGFQLIYTEMTEMLTTYFKVAIMTGVALALPVIVYQVLRFVAPALTMNEKRYFIFLLPGVLVAFAIGVAFGYFLVVPLTVKYLLTFSGVATPFIKVGNYVGFIATMLFWIGLSFESPIVIFFLAKMRIVTPKKLASYRKYAIVLIFIVAAIITPSPDPISQSIVAIPLLALYEIGILLARFA